MATITFLPDRLNAEPVIFRGFTTPELGFTVLLSLVGGLVVAIPVAPLLGWVAFPTIALLMPLITVMAGGQLLMRFKRGKPQHYLYRLLAQRLAELGIASVGQVTESRRWALRRRQIVKRREAVHDE
ncbi:TPA: TIGR03750 family conjugal transfer protein [Enterobacter hormaechei]|nr:TIGR03750 family conjugal transfer protein [Enterobacter hormaechei]